MIHGVIMAGGSGTRFWPDSTKSRPKQLLSIVGPKTMIRETVERIAPVIPLDRVLVVTGLPYLEDIKRELPELRDSQLIAEPVGRNTAPCIALAAHQIQKTDPDGIMAVLPADHMIRKEEEFLEALRIAAATVAQSGSLLTFGIIPSRPETGYGYIRIGLVHSRAGSGAVRHVDRFVEKPDLSTAEAYLESGEYMWNSGMFVWKVVDIIAALDEYLPEVNAAIREISHLLGGPQASEAIASAYAKIQPISIDHGIMERAENVVCLPIDVDWSDVGCWASLEGVWDSDGEGNTVRGEVIAFQSKDCIVSSSHKLTTLIGAENLIVVDTPDALMICRKDRAQDVRKLQEILIAKGYEHLL